MVSVHEYNVTAAAVSLLFVLLLAARALPKSGRESETRTRGTCGFLAHHLMPRLKI